MKTIKAIIPSMGSNHCVMAVKSIIEKLNGATVKEIEIGKTEIEYNDAIITSPKIIEEIEKAGYEVSNSYFNN